MKNLITQGLTGEEKEQVFVIIEDWISKNKFQSVSSSGKIPTSILKIVIDIFDVADKEVLSSAKKKERAMKWLNEFPKLSVFSLSKKQELDLAQLIKHLRQDEQVEKLSYEQTLFFLQWIRRLLPEKYEKH